MGMVIKGYFIFPFVFGCILAGITIALTFVNDIASLICLGALVIYIIALVFFNILNGKQLEAGLIRFARQYGGLEGELISDFPLPYAVTDPEGRILAYNKIFSRIYDEKTGQDNITQIFHELDEEDLKFDGQSKNVSVVYDNRNFRLNIKKLKVSEELLENKIALLPKHDMTLLTIYLFDETEIINLMKKNAEDQMVIASVMIDNYEDIFNRNANVAQSLNMALIDRTLAQYFETAQAVVRKLEKDRYIVVFKKKYLSALQSGKFRILDQLKDLDIGSDQPVTVSIGIGLDEDYQDSLKLSQEALELALGRGGDQVIVKEGARTYFYGGKTKQAEKNSRVKARLKANALRQIIMSHERVVVMGHKNADMDSFAAAVGIYRAVRALGKNAYIAIQSVGNTVKPLMNDLMSEKEYAQGVFLNAESVGEFVNKDTVLVIVDVNRPELFEFPEISAEAGAVVVIDHHRQSGEKIDNVELIYAEPTASSTSEMVTEILQYIANDIKINKNEAEALYAGILMDTVSFTRNTGARTFEAAAYLRKKGADTQKVQDMFSDTLQVKQAKAKAMETVEEIADGFVLAQSGAETQLSTVLAAQVANELLTVKGIKASFVFSQQSDTIFISARSKGDINVQLIMEKMGGGGHMNMAAAQLSDMDMEEAKRILKATVRKTLEEETS